MNHSESVPLEDKPVIALVGRPNVGKSTLFNRLTRTQDALVADFPGLTRDRQYGEGVVGDFPYLLIDTGGLSGEDDLIDSAMAEQVHLAVEEADLVMFLVDARDGLSPLDIDIANTLRRSAQRLMLVVNKSDGVGEERAALEFHQLGIPSVHTVAASKNRGIRQLMDGAKSLLSDTMRVVDKPAEAEGDARHRIRIAFIGRPNVGKSTLINRLLGEERVIARDRPGTTRDSIAIPFLRNEKHYTLIDTAGVRRRGQVHHKVEKFSVVRTLQAIEHSNVTVLLMDAQDGVTVQDLHLLGHVIDQGRALVVGINKWDAINAEQRESLRESLERRVPFLKFTRIHYISALRGSGVNDLMKSVNRAHTSAFADLATPRLTRLLETFVQQHQPPTINGRRIKLRYAHQGGINPPLIVVHGRQASKLPEAYKRYLSNQYQQSLHLFGTPLRLEFKDGENPFAGKKAR